MKTLKTHKSPIRKLMLALFGLIAMTGMLVAAQGASAAVSHAPIITATPADPNTTHSTVRFDYEVDDAETSTGPVLFFRCRIYVTGTSPGPNDGWFGCGTTSNKGASWMVNSAQPNGNRTFQVGYSDVSSTSNPNPALLDTYSWTQNVTAPTLPPVITAEPESDVVAGQSPGGVFEFEPGVGEENLVQPNLYQCRFNSSDDADWGFCTYPQGNGTYTFEVRARNQHGAGPGTEPISVTVDVPNPAPSVRLSEIAGTTWGKTVPFAGTREDVKNIGDLNNDGLDDVATSSREIAEGYIDVVFSGKNGMGARTLGNQSAEQGFRVLPPADPFAFGDPAYYPAGDQNGDGKDDLVVFVKGPYFPPGPNTTAVIYGGFDVEALPVCPTGSAHCVDLGSLTPEQGYQIATNGVNYLENVIDIDGDGAKDLLYKTELNEFVAVKGAERSGSVDIADIPDNQLKQYVGTSPPAEVKKTYLGDLDGDGKEEIYFLEPDRGTAHVVYGSDFGGDPVDVPSLGDDDKFIVRSLPFSNPLLSNIGDVNGDGRVDLALSQQFGAAGLTEDLATIEVVYAPERGADFELIWGQEADPSSGYVINRGGPNATQLGSQPTTGIGDLNNDGVPDFLGSAEGSPVDGISGSGSANVLFGQNPAPADPLGIGPALTPDLGVALLGDLDSGASTGMASLGDIDGDGLSDFSVLAAYASPNGVPSAGSVYIVYGKSLINQVKTGNAVGVGNESAVLNAGLSTNDRDSEVWFEYGTSDEYGEATDPQEFEGSSNGDAASVAVDGLAKNTTYHYRAVAKNELGLVRYGDDRTFTTTNAEAPSNCDTDDSLPGCANYDRCAADNTQPGCSGYDHCAVKPADCQGGNSKARLAIVPISKKIAVKRGKRGTVQVAVINTGGKVAKGVKVCVKAPKRLVKVKKCVKVGNLGSGASRTVKIKVQAKKKRGKAVLKHTAKGNNVSAKKAKTRVVIR